jgi:hypothetical protein
MFSLGESPLFRKKDRDKHLGLCDDFSPTLVPLLQVRFYLTTLSSSLERITRYKVTSSYRTEPQQKKPRDTSTQFWG